MSSAWLALASIRATTRRSLSHTIITLENEFWEQLRIIAVTRNVVIRAAGRN
jgi:predicted DNA-binding ribbon-helix-helix protein